MNRMNLRPKSNSGRQRRLSFIAALATMSICMLVASLPAAAQQITGTFEGTVKDAQGAVIAGAQVRAINVETNLSRVETTNSQGVYIIENLPVGHYNVEVESPGFQKFLQENLLLTVEQTQTLNVTLTVGAASQTVTVTEAPPLINTSDAVLGRTIEPDEIVGLPLVNRNIYSEVTLTPGVMANGNSPSSNPSGNPTLATGLYIEDVQINGSMDGGSAAVAFYLDGGNNITGMRNYGNPSPNPDAVEEFRVETSAFGAQYGQFSAAVVSVVTKSGTNQFHGGLFEFNRNTDFNANSWAPAHNAQGQIIVTPYHRNQFGGDVGGPVKKDKSFFFFSYGGVRQVTDTVFTGAITPTANERLGDFTGDTFTVYTPGAAHTAANQVDGTNSSPNCQVAAPNCIPQALLDTTIANFDNVNNKIGSSIPLPNGALNPSKGGGAYAGLFPTPTTEDEYLGKYDQNLGDKDHVAATFFWSRNVLGASPGGNVPWTINQSASDSTNINLSEVHTFSPATANQAWLSYTRAAGGRVNLPFSGPASQTLTSYGSNFLIQGPPALPSFSETNFSATTTNAGPFTGSDNYELRDMISITKGKHNLFIGGEFALDKTMFFADLLNFASISFATSAPTSTGNVTSDWVTGQASSAEQDSPYVTHLSTWHVAAFVQDNYRFTPRFTANLGVRWDIDTPPVDAHNRTESFIPGQQSTVAPLAPEGLLFPGDAGIGRGIISTKYYHLSPRVGFAYDPFGDGKTSIRGAAGIFFGTVAGNEWNQPGNAIPFALRPQTGEGPLNSITNFYSYPGDFPSTASGGGLFPYTYTSSSPTFISGPGGATEAISPKFKYPYVYQFNLSVQRQLPGRVTLTAAYVGALSHQLPNFIDVNYAPYSTAFGTPSTSATSIADRRQFDPCVGACPKGAAAINNGTGILGAQIVDLLSNLTANYNSLQISASKQLFHNFSASGFYVWSHALDSFEPDADGLSSPQDSGYFGAPFTSQNNSLGAVGGGIQEEYGSMNADVRHNAAISGTWNLDYFHGDNKIVKEVVNGWQISPIVYLHSGGVFTVTTGANKSFDSTNNQRPDAVSGQNPVLSPHRCRVCATNSETSEWFNTAAFTANGPGVTGGIGPGGADGNVARNSLFGPGFKDIDMGLFRNIKFERGIVFQLRGEATNVFNLVSLANPTASLASGNYGKITSAAGTQRIIQVGGRLTF
ncbi:carboxypeptidase regulatory-like domain-containing protein [Acidicapsa dinghuensis]|uniref:Carboxypeptidase regulatory-like domain-containing protein n=2 Tax=Acidicapsa dinghuensis TaxID=2218256 RepID=A0ABW1EKL0_9BACT|nr:TonB-dependent receptor [Acidicapsa dinghuensis]